MLDRWIHVDFMLEPGAVHLKSLQADVKVASALEAAKVAAGTVA